MQNQTIKFTIIFILIIMQFWESRLGTA